jgi:hypothetical protein
MKFIGKVFFHNNITSLWSYIYDVKIGKDTDISFNDGEVESVEWLSLEEIINKINLGDKITPDSIECFNYYINKLL